MGHIVIKPRRDRDEYVYWSTVVEAPIGYGSRDEMLHALADDWPADPPEVRLARTDKTGSSSKDVDYGWDDTELIYEQRGMLAREHLYRAAALLREGRESEVWDLLAPFEGETEVRRG
jgi:hypothetical protein